MSILAGYLMPHAPVFIDKVSGAQSKAVSKTLKALDDIAIEIEQLKPDTIVIISPHGPIFSDAVAIYDLKTYQGHLHAFGEYDLSYAFEKDEELCERLLEESNFNNGYFYPLKETDFKRFQYPIALDHGVTVPLHFISERYNQFKLLAMSYGTFSYTELLKHGEIIQRVADASPKRIIIIASGDMSHALKSDGPYAYNPDGPWFDNAMCEHIENQTPYEIFNLPLSRIEKASECGLRSFAIMLGAFNKRNIKTKNMSYEGPFGVGYLVAKVDLLNSADAVDQIELINQKWREATKQNQTNAHPYVQIANAVITHYTKHKYSPVVTLKEDSIEIESKPVFIHNALREDLTALKRGVFVSIKKMGALRGCIGTIIPNKKNLLTEIVSNAISSCSKDYRFDPIEENELELLTISVDILSELERITDVSCLNPKKYGVTVHSKGRMGVLLPDLDGVDTVEEQLKIASNKAGFKVEEIEYIERFSVERYK